MTQTKFKTPFNRDKFPVIPEQGSGELLVDTSGYVSAERRITALIMAGQRLVSSRREAYDFSSDQDIDENFIDPTRRKNYDMADATQDGLSLAAKYPGKANQDKSAEKDSEKLEKSIPDESK